MAASVLRHPPPVPPGHYSSPLTSYQDVERAIAMTPNAAPGVDLREKQQLELAQVLAPMWSQTPQDLRYNAGPGNTMYSLPDAVVYSSLIRHLEPSRILEVGSGYSSAVALDTAERWQLYIDMTFVEPHPERLLGLLTDQDRERRTLRREPVQETPLELFAQLGDQDILFIDSTHVVKPGSDVWWLVLHVLPRLASGVYVHVHDIHWPFQYPDHWLRRQRDWTEAYLLHAFLAYNSAFDIVLYNNWLWTQHPEIVAEHLPAAQDVRCGGIWLRRR
jgi:hypothetical protein